MNSQEFESLMDEFAALLEDVDRFGVTFDMEALRTFLSRNPNLVELIREREYDTHNRVRLSYDKTVADSWSAEVAKRDERIARLEDLIAGVEHDGVPRCASCRDEIACPWCGAQATRSSERVTHLFCEAFSAPGEVRR